MKKYYILIVFLVCIINKGFSQKSMSDYSYIIVSDQFDFQDEKDKYQLNSLIKFLYNKHGFHAYFKDEVPENVRRCDGLYADAEGKPGFLITKVAHVIRDCDGNEVFRTEKGASNIKDYRNAYYEAARASFNEIRDQYVNQKGIIVYEEVAVIQPKKDQGTEPENIVAPTVVASSTLKETEVKEIASNDFEAASINNQPSAKYSNYSYLDKTFLLRKTKEGYSFYEESDESDDGLLLIGELVFLKNILIFTDVNKKVFNAEFDASKNLIIEKGEAFITYKLEN